MNTRSALLALPLVLVGCGGQVDEATTVEPEALHGNNVHELVNAAPLAAAKRTSNLVDHGGGVVPGLRLNVIYWGTGFEPTTQSLYTTFLQGLPGSGYWTINNQYLRGKANSASYGASYHDTSAPPATVSDAALQAEVHKVLAAGHLAYSATSLYYVVTPKNVSVCSGGSCSCTAFCGYHSSYDDSTFGTTLYSTIPSAAACPTACGTFASDAASPNGNVEADEGVSILAHEGEETQSDAFGTAWYDRSGNENADKCAYKYGTTTTSNGAQVNQSWGGKSWLVQMNWSNQISNCAEHGPSK
jgi:hypothetical protein